MADLPSRIISLSVWTIGDASVGIQGGQAEVKAAGDFLINLDSLAPEDQRAAIEAFRRNIANAFAELWGESVNVAFDFETAND